MDGDAMYIQRMITNELIKLMNSFPVVGIIGPRQVGKTSLAKYLIKIIKKDTLYLDLELPEDQSKLSEPQLFLEHYSDKCIILDEIQQMPHLFPVLRALIDKDRQAGRYLILGSASPNLLKQSSETLAGRIVYKQLSPFNLTEIAHEVEMNTHWHRGGFPPALLATDDENFITWMRNFVQTYLERDLPMLGLTVSPTLMRRFWTMLAYFHGGIWNASSFANALGITVPTVNRYLDFLESAFIVNRLQPYYLNIKKRLVKSPKIYLRDSGLLHYLTGIFRFDALLGNIIIGNSWEGYVIEQIQQHIPEEFELYYYRTHNGAESDLVIVHGNKPLACIEIKYTSAPKASKGFSISIADLNTTQNFIITPYSDSYPISENIFVCNLMDFLTEHLPSIISY